MGLSQQVASQEPVRKTLPPKPKKTHTQELTQREHKVLPKKSDSNEMESFDQIFSDNYGLEEFPFLNTPPMEYVSPASAEDASYFDSGEADTEPMCAEEEVWGNLGCVSPVDAEGIEDVKEAKVDLNAVLDFNLERREEVIYEFTLPVEADENNSFSLNLEPDLNLLGRHPRPRYHQEHLDDVRNRHWPNRCQQLDLAPRAHPLNLDLHPGLLPSTRGRLHGDSQSHRGRGNAPVHGV